MARATAGSVSIQSVPDGVSGESVQLAVDITKGNALYDFVECVWTADDGTIVDTTSARVISFWALGATPPTAPTNVTTWNYNGNTTWTRGGSQPSATTLLNVYKAIRIEHFDGTAPSATTFVSASWGDGVTKVADAVPVVTTRQRHIYRLSGAAPSDFDLASDNGHPFGITTDGTYLYVVDRSDGHVYVYTLAGARQSSREFGLHNSNSDPDGITTDGTYLYVVDDGDDHVYVYTLAGARQSSREFALHSSNSSPDGITTDGTYLYITDNSVPAHVYVYTLAGARQSTREFDVASANGHPFGLTTDGTYLYVVDWGDNKVYVYTIAGAQQSAREFNLHNDNADSLGITTDGTYFYVVNRTDDKVYVYNPNNVSEVPTAPNGGTSTAAYIPSGWQATEPDPTSTQAVYRATRTETFSNGVFTSATVYGSVTKVADKVAFVPTDFDLASANAAPRGITTDGTYLYVADVPEDHVYVYTLAGARQSTREFDLTNLNTSPQGITTDGTYLYVMDVTDNYVYVYTLAGARQSGREFSLAGLNNNAQGITTDGTYLYVVDAGSLSDRAYVYTLAGARQSTREFNLPAANNAPDGITTDGTYLYVVDQADDYVYVYTLAGARQSGREFDLLDTTTSSLADGNTNPRGITTDGTYFYVVDATADKVYVYPRS